MSCSGGRGTGRPGQRSPWGRLIVDAGKVGSCRRPQDKEKLVATLAVIKAASGEEGALAGPWRCRDLVCGGDPPKALDGEGWGGAEGFADVPRQPSATIGAPAPFCAGLGGVGGVRFPSLTSISLALSSCWPGVRAGAGVHHEYERQTAVPGSCGRAGRGGHGKGLCRAGFRGHTARRRQAAASMAWRATAVA